MNKMSEKEKLTRKEKLETLGVLLVITLVLLGFVVSFQLDYLERERRENYISFFEEIPITAHLHFYSLQEPYKIDPLVNQTPFRADYQVSFETRNLNSTKPFIPVKPLTEEKIVLDCWIGIAGLGLMEGGNITNLNYSISFDNYSTPSYSKQIVNVSTIAQPEIASFYLEIHFRFKINVSEIEEIFGVKW